MHPQRSSGVWTTSVAVDDEPYPADAAVDAWRSIEVIVLPPPSGLQRPGDARQDGKLDLSDAVRLLGHLFLGSPGQETLPCEGRTASSPGPGDLALADVNGDGRIDPSDAVRTLGFLFLGPEPPVLGTQCVRIEGLPEISR
ncbi:MAG: dockerin type I repeat-containing protein [Planctomycetes bacterium]|nr:dockerin type I repeat-containing protein [Planctomycetota bacterium]